jgi:drug/metabolite transporter (DMT)-like permease
MGEKLSWGLFFGALMIIGGVLWVNYGTRVVKKPG